MKPYDTLFDLTGKSALVTGSSSGIGLAIARGFAAHGARVAISSNEPEACDRVVGELQAEGAEAFAFPCDVSDPLALDELAEAVTARFGAIDILVSNAGGIAPKQPGDLSLNSEGFEATWRQHLGQALRLTDRVCPAMAARKDGVVIFTASISGLRGNKGIGAYAMAKAGMAQLARNLAVQWGPDNVRANAIAPGLIRTPFASGMIENAPLMERRLGLTPLRRVGEPYEVAGAAVFLASRAGGFVTGQTLVVDGGTVISDGG